MNLAQPPVIPTPVRRQLSLFLKIAGICFLILALHIPLLMTNGVLQERRKFQQQAIDEIAGVWGRSQLVTGPVLAVPYTVKTQVMRAKGLDGLGGQVVETELTAQVAYFLPESLTVAGTVEPELRHRGIYDAVVYSTKLNLTGWFQPDFAAANIAAEQIQCD
jgi:inner membrane protein